MNWKTWVPLAVAIVLGVAAAKMTLDLIKKNRSTTTTTQNLTKVVVAKADIPPGTELTAEQLTYGQIAKDGASDRVFTSIEEVVGRVNEVDMIKGQTVLAPMLAATGSGSGLQALVPVGMRAITIEVNEFSGIAGMLTPGCRVDVVVTLREGAADGSVARTIVENVKVTAVGARVSGTSEEQAQQEVSKSVTLLVSPEQAEAIELAAATARPRLVLRSGRDNQPSKTQGITVAQLVGSGVQSQTGPAAAVKPTEVATVDPFTQSLPEAAATTRPSVVETTATTAKDNYQMPTRRSIQIIRNGVESMVSITLPKAHVIQASDFAQSDDDGESAGEYTETPTEPAIPR